MDGTVISMDDIRHTITNITKTITQTSGGIIKSTKLSMNLANEEAALRNLYTEMGKKVCEIYSFGGSLGKVFDEKYKEVEAAEARIEALKNQLDLAKGVRTCPKCGKTAPKTAEFCPKCGGNMAGVPVMEVQEVLENIPSVFPAERIPPTPDPIPSPATDPVPVQEADIPPVLSGVTCRVCHTINPPEERFCLSCGRMLS